MIMDNQKSVISKKKQWNIRNDNKTIKHLQMNQISTLNNPQGVGMPLNK